MDSLYIVMPAYNEEDNIEAVVRQWYKILEGKALESRHVVADSGSVDKTHEILMHLQRELSQLEILEKTLKQHGPKLIAMYRYASEKVQIMFFGRIRMDRQILMSLRNSGIREMNMTQS